MAEEIERKFLTKAGWRPSGESSRIAQGYLSRVPGRTVRVRLRGERGYLTVKGRNDESGIARQEFEYEIPPQDAEALLRLCEPGIIEKERFLLPAAEQGHVWEVDVFHGENEGLIVAEIELARPDEPFARPDWLAEEVTGDVRFYNSSLSRAPYPSWRS